MSVDPTIINEVAEVANAVHETAEMAKNVGPVGAFGLNTKIFIAQLVNFGIVLLVLWRFAYRPIVNILEKREETIAKSMKDAEAIEKRLEETATEKEDILKSARVESQSILEKAQAGMDAREKEMVAKAKGEVAKVVAQGKERIVAEREQMMSDLKAEVADLAIMAAEKVLKESVDAKKSKDIAQDALNKTSL